MIMDKSDDILIFQETSVGALEVEIRLIAIIVDNPIIVGVFVVVAGDLLLLTSLGIELDVRMEETASVSGILDGDFRSVGDFKGRVRKIRSFEIGLEERGHLRVTRARILKNQEVNPEGEHVDQRRQNNETKHTSRPMSEVGSLSLDQ